MELNKIIKKIHRIHESKGDGDRITHEVMASKLGISKRAYAEYYRGKNQPLAMKVLFRMFKELENDEIINVVRMWKEDELIEKSSINKNIGEIK